MVATLKRPPPEAAEKIKNIYAAFGEITD